MTDILVDSNVLIDVLGQQNAWSGWSAHAMAAARRNGDLVINPVILAEVSIAYASAAELDAALVPSFFRRDPLPYEAAFLAGRAFVAYRSRGGSRSAPLPDFFIGAHAAVRGYRLVTRDRGYYRTYFPTLDIVSPDQRE